MKCFYSFVSCLVFSGSIFAHAPISGAIDDVNINHDAQPHSHEHTEDGEGKKNHELNKAISQAQLYIMRARQTADQEEIDKAEKILQPWLEESNTNPNPKLQMTLAQVYLFNHRFDGAMNLLNKLISEDQHYAQATLSRAMLYQLHGNYPAALNDCKRLLNQSQLMIGAICSLITAGMTGKLEQSYNALLSVAKKLNTMPESIQVWVLVNLADMAERIGNFSVAESSYLSVLEYSDIDQSVRESYAEYLLQQGETEKLLSFASSVPVSDGMLLRIGAALKKANQSNQKNIVLRLSARLYQNNSHASKKHLREQAYFQLRILDDPGAALPLAHKNWEQQKEPIDLQLYLQAAVAMGQQDVVNDIANWVAMTGYQDKLIKQLIQQTKYM